MNQELKVSIQTGNWYNRVFNGDQNPDEAFAFIRSCGFDTLDYNIDNTLTPAEIRSCNLNHFYDDDFETLKEYFRPIKEAMEHHGISFGQTHASFPLYVEEDDTVNAYVLQAVAKQIMICEYLGCPALVVHPYSCDDKEREKEINLNIYRYLMPYGKKHGVKICLENMFRVLHGHMVGGACAEASEACWYIDKLNEEAGEEVFGYCFDVGHANLCSRNIREELRTLGHRLTILHIHDNDAQNDSHMVPYTQNDRTDWEGFILGLRDINYRGTLDFEVFAALDHLPWELVAPMIKYVYEIGLYMRKRILE